MTCLDDCRERVAQQFAKFVDTNTEHNWECELKVGHSFLDVTTQEARNLHANHLRQVDLVVDRESKPTLIIEAKNEFGTTGFDEALGQALVSNHLYQKDRDLENEETLPVVLMGEPVSAPLNLEGPEGETIHFPKLPSGPAEKEGGREAVASEVFSFVGDELGVAIITDISGDVDTGEFIEHTNYGIL